jgi:hypothetical protein
MKLRNILWRFIKWLFTLAFTLFVTLLWGSLSLLEIILHHLNVYLKKIIS